MTDTEILNALQSLIQEHFAEGGTPFDMPIGRMQLTVHRPAPVHVPRATAVIQEGTFDLRALLALHITPHIPRLVTRELTKNR